MYRAYKTSLLVSRDEFFQKTRALVLQQGGYCTIGTGNMTCALELDRHCQMSIIGHTVSPDEQAEFIDRVHESYPDVCLRFQYASAGAIEVSEKLLRRTTRRLSSMGD